jgi:hypothetical protein
MAEYEIMLSFRVDDETLRELDLLVGSESEENRSLLLRRLIADAYLERLAVLGNSLFSKKNMRNWNMSTDEARALFANQHKWLFNRWLRKLKRRI